MWTTLYRTWQDQAKAKSLKLDPERSVIVLVALDNKKVAVHSGSTLREKLGLSNEVMSDDLINRAFIPLAREGKFPEAIASLLTATNNFLAQRDTATAAVEGRGLGTHPGPADRRPTTVPASRTTRHRHAEPSPGSPDSGRPARKRSSA